MNYELQYEKLINRAKDRKINGYTERHHIIPKCMNGTDEKDNLVDLTAREHFIAHLLLLKIYPKQYGLIKAVMMMTVGNSIQKEHRSMNRMYSWLKEKHSNEMSRLQNGNKNSQYGTIWVSNLDLKESKKFPKDEFSTWEQEGWLKGRVIDFKEKHCAYCKSIIKTGMFCSKKCKAYFRSPNYKKIDDNIDLLIEEFKQNKSIEKTLKVIGLYNKIGNSYLSTILKSKGFNILKRRNTLK